MDDAVEAGEVKGIRVGRYPWAINTTCVCYRVGRTLIDTGPPNQYQRVLKFARERPLQQILLTHHHEDHCGNAAPLSRELGLPVLAPPQSLAFLADGFKVHLYRRLVWGKPEPSQAQPIGDAIDAGDGIQLRPILTPGHSPDMTCFLEEGKGWLFAGDLFVAARPRYLRADENLGQTVKSLRALLKFEFDTLFCGHRGVVHQAREQIGAKLDYLEDLRGQVRERRQRGETISAITLELLGKEDFLSWFSGGHFSKRNLVQACCEPSRTLAGAGSQLEN